MIVDSIEFIIEEFDRMYLTRNTSIANSDKMTNPSQKMMKFDEINPNDDNITKIGITMINVSIIFGKS